MAVNAREPSAPSSAGTGRRMLIGTNVIIGIVLVAGIVAVVQAIGYSVPVRWDMTSSGVNSLSEGTENLLRGLDSNVRLTSLYFETDREEEDQPRYRQAATNLVDLYEATNRSKVTAEWINPLKDHERFQKLLKRLAEKTAFKDEIEQCRARINEYKNTLDDRMQGLIQSELQELSSMGGGIGGASVPATLQRLELALNSWSGELEAARQRIDALTPLDRPQYSAAISELRSLYRQVGKALKDIGVFGPAEVARSSDLPPDAATFLRGTGARYAEVTAAIEAEEEKLKDLGSLKIDEVIQELSPTANAILVETDDDARVVDFSTIWPPLDQRASGPRAPFRHRAFKGEEKLTAALLRVTHKEQTAVVFVRYGGQALFIGGFMPGQPPAPYSAIKQQLKDTNFAVEEWDLKSSDTPPEIDPKPTRTLYVVLMPTPAQRGPFGQPSQEPPFTESHRRAILTAIGEGGRALFLAGWAPGPFGPIPATYEYNDYLKDTWGISIDTSALLIETSSIAPGRYVVTRRDFHAMDDLTVLEHDIMRGIEGTPLGFPWCAPVELGDPPEGVEHFKLVSQAARDGLWGIKNIQAYEDQFREREYLVRAEGDLEGPFDLAAAATKDDAKIVVISSRGFAEDSVAFARELAMSANGFTVRLRNAGNVTLLVNSLHWLNDNTDFMNIGKPINAAVLEVDKATVRLVQAFAIVVWPMLALCCGGVAWWVRRR